MRRVEWPVKTWYGGDRKGQEARWFAGTPARKEYNMKTVCKVAAIVCMVAIFGQVGRCDAGEIGMLACLAGIILWSMLGALFLALTGWLEHVR